MDDDWDILKPPLIWIGNRCYRKNPSKDSTVDRSELIEDYTVPIADDDDDEICDIDSTIEQTDKGYRSTVDLPSDFFKFIIGKKGENKRRLESETRTLIRIPKAGQEGLIEILGHDRPGVKSAHTRIDIIADSARQKLQFTHFLSFPITGPSIRDKFEEFKYDVMRQCDGDRGLDTTIFQKTNKLHLTMGTMVLLNEREVTRAASLLEEINENLIRPVLRDEPLVCNIVGLEYMNDDPNDVDVLYAKVEPIDHTDKLQILADRISEKMTSAGIMQRDYDRVKLHITVMNTKFRKDPTGASIVRRERPRGNEWESSDRRDIERESFDATNVLRKFGHYDFGTFTIPCVHISDKMRTSPDGYYACAGLIHLPT